MDPLYCITIPAGIGFIPTGAERSEAERRDLFLPLSRQKQVPRRRRPPGGFARDDGGGSILQQDRQGLPVGDFGPFLELGERAGADRVLDPGEGVVGNAQDPGDVPGRHLKGCRADHHRPLAELLEGDAVVQTARRAGPSIPQAGDQEVDLRRHRGERVGGRRRTGVLLGGELHDRAAVALDEELGHLVQHLLGIELAVFQDADAGAKTLMTSDYFS